MNSRWWDPGIGLRFRIGSIGDNGENQREVHKGSISNLREIMRVRFGKGGDEGANQERDSRES